MFLIATEELRTDFLYRLENIVGGGSGLLV